MGIWFWLAAAVVAVLLVLVVRGLWHLSNRVIKIRVWEEPRITQFEVDSGMLDLVYLKALPKEEVSISSPFGYPLKGWFIPAAEPARGTVILVHGVTRSRLSSIKYVELFRKRGFHVLAYDHRRHGQSGGSTTTYGIYEKTDLNAWVDWVQARTGSDAVIGIHGESMGAATSLQHAAIDSRASFYIADCPYSDMVGQLIYRMRVEYPRLPVSPLMPLVVWFCKLRAGIRLGEASSLDSIGRVETPVLFIHGEQDTYIEKRMTEEMYHLKPGKKGLYLAPNADHAEAYMKNPDEYDRIVGEFLKDIGVMD